MKMLVRTLMVALAIGAGPAALTPTPVLAKSHKMASNTAASRKTVYVCTECKTYFPTAVARKLHYKDSMGHKLVKKHGIPAGFTNGAKMEKGGKM